MRTSAECQIILTGLNNKEIGAYAVEMGAHDFLVKGQTEDRLLECIMQCSIECKREYRKTKTIFTFG